MVGTLAILTAAKIGARTNVGIQNRYLFGQEALMWARVLVFILLSTVLPAAAQINPPPPEPAVSRAALDAQIKAAEAELARIGAEQQAVHQQFQMVEGMRRHEMDAMRNPPGATAPLGPPPNYDDVVRDRKAQEQRLQGFASEMNRLYARYRELEEQKRPLLDQLSDLTLQRR